MFSPATILASLAVLAWTSQPSGVGTPAHDDVQIRINGPLTVARGDTATTVWVVNHDATVDGVVRDGLGVINGTARVSGRVEGGVVVVNGHLDLAPGAVIGRDVMLYRSTITRANDAVINGVVHDQRGFSLGAGAVWLIWLSFTIVVVLAGVVFAEVAPVTLADSTELLAKHTGQAAVTALVVVVAVPAIAIASFATVIGIPLGLVLFLVVVPALSFLGYLVSGSLLGTALGGRLSSGSDRARQRTSMVVGLVTLQFAVALPVIGGLVGLVASLLGVGAFVARGWSHRNRPVPVPVVVGA